MAQTQELSTKRVSVLDFAAACEADLNVLAATCAPTVFTHDFPELYQSCFHWLTKHAMKTNDFSKLALGFPRGFAKTTMIKLFVVWCILFSKRKYIVVISANMKPQAANFIADVMAMLTEPNIIAVFGDYRVGLLEDTQTYKVFNYMGRTIILQAVGIAGAIRGTNRDNSRPDVMVFEDTQSRELANSEAGSAALEEWMYGTAMKAKAPTGCLYVFVANMYPTPYSILRKLSTNPTWLKFIVGGILSNGTSLWEALHPVRNLLAEYESDRAAGMMAVFLSEVLNDATALQRHVFDTSLIAVYEEQQGEQCIGSYIVIDPASGNVGGDDVSIGVVQVMSDILKPVLWQVKAGKFSPSETIDHALHLAYTHGCSLIAVEATGYQSTLLHWFDKRLRTSGVAGIRLVPIHSGAKSKVARILNMFTELRAKDIYIHPQVRAVVYDQIIGFNPQRNNNEDGVLDLLVYTMPVYTTYQTALAIPSELIRLADTNQPLSEVATTNY